MIIDRINPTESTEVLIAFEMDANSEKTHALVHGKDKYEVMTAICELAEAFCNARDVEPETLLHALKWYFKGAK